MNYFLDTEFIESGRQYPIQLISIGIVSQDGREYHAISSEFDPDSASPWVKENVLSKLERGMERKTVDVIAQEIIRFVGTEKPVFYGYYADYDWVVFCQLFGLMIDLPKGWPMYCRDLKQMLDDKGNPPMPKPLNAHHVLSDARWNRDVYNTMQSIANLTNL